MPSVSLGRADPMPGRRAGAGGGQPTMRNVPEMAFPGLYVAVQAPERAAEPVRPQTLVLEDFPNPLLARRLSPNGRVHWAVRAEAKRIAAHRIACECLLQSVVPADGPVRLAFRWVFPTAGRRDLDNLIATAKPLIDSMVTAGVLTDDDSTHVVSIAASVAHEKGRRALEITIDPAPTSNDELLAGRRRSGVR